MRIALLTTFLAGYRAPLYERLAERFGVEVLCYGGGERYVPAWFTDLDAELSRARFPARRLRGAREAFTVALRYDAVIAPFAGGSKLLAAYAGARTARRPFVLWASVWRQPRSIAHAAALPLTRHIYRHADAVVAYGEHVRRYVSQVRGRDSDVFVAPQAVEPDLFGRTIAPDEMQRFRDEHGLGSGPLVLYVGRLVEAKGIATLLAAWRDVRNTATLVLIGDGPLAAEAQNTPGVRMLGALPRERLPVAYGAARFAVLPSIPTPRFTEPWGLVCNEAMHQGRPIVATTAVGAVAGGLVRDQQNGLVVAPQDAATLKDAIEELLTDNAKTDRLGQAARKAVAPYTYDAMVEGFERALATAISPSPTGPWKIR